MNCPKCDLPNVERLTVIEPTGLRKVIGNCCQRCGTDIRPFHEEILKTSHLRPLSSSVSNGSVR